MTLDFKWKRSPFKRCGVLCGADRTQEWMLPWWWSRYSEHNDFPVTFCDFGMSEEMKTWCAQKGEVVSIHTDELFIHSRSAVDPQLAELWEKSHGWDVWHRRHCWFKKPFALLNSPYETGLWVDLDCEILGSLEPLFSTPSDSPIALVRESPTDHLPKYDPEVRYNGGVIAFQHNAKIIEKWAEASAASNHQYAGDDVILSHLISQERLDVVELPQIYNWRVMRGLNLDAVVVHWVSSSKNYIRTHGGLKPALDTFFRSCKGFFK